MNPQEQNNQPSAVGSSPVTENSQLVSPVAPGQSPSSMPVSPTPAPKKSKKALIIALAIGVLIVIGTTAYLTVFAKEKNNNKKTSNEVISTSECGATQDCDNQDVSDKDAKNPDENSSGSNDDSSMTGYQKDNQLKNNASRLAAGITEYLANNNGKPPALSDLDSDFQEEYFKDKNAYVIVEQDPKTGELQFRFAAKCGDDGSIIEGKPRQFVVRGVLTDGSYLCVGDW